jgi:hypothetical protein
MAIPDSENDSLRFTFCVSKKKNLVQEQMPVRMRIMTSCWYFMKHFTLQHPCHLKIFRNLGKQVYNSLVLISYL